MALDAAAWRSAVDRALGEVRERIGRLEEAVVGLRHSMNLLIGVIGVLTAIVLFGLGYMNSRIDRIDAKIDSKFDSLSTRISEESARTRQEMNSLSARIGEESARTRQELIGIATAISNSITAARQPPPPPPPQPQPQPPPSKE